MRVLDIILEVKAYHGSNHHFEEFSIDHVGTGKGYQTFGYGIYLTREKHIASRYRKRGTGRIYVVDMPDDSEFINWNLLLPQQPEKIKAILKKLKYPDIVKRLVDDEQVTAGYLNIDGNTGENIYGTFVSEELAKYPPEQGDYQEIKKATSFKLARAGIAGIKYQDVESGNAVYYNYVIFDPRRIKIEKHLK